MELTAMEGQTATVVATISAELKEKADEMLANRGLTVSDALRMMLESTLLGGVIPRYWLGPNIETREAMEELERGGGKTYDSVEALMADLHAED